ncbi:DNA polymerase III beta subunit [hydrothermal vent metagenome]|uniref:DNA polymerase III beta subunit n=1 Tax=hydrothermal vent metagenome TaxID=652676 RepID=A0A3B1BRG4_9ZZZZ
MKLRLQREALLKPLQIVGNIIERRPSLTILSNILVQVSDGIMTLTGTDLEVEMVTRLAVENDENDEITLPGKKFIDICKALPEQAEIELTTTADRCVIRSGRSRFTLSTLPGTEFPNIDAVTSPFEFSLTQKELKQLIENTQFCMAQQDVRYYLNGLLLEISEDKLSAVATDGHRLALSELSGTFDVTETRQIILPKKGVNELARLLDDSDSLLKIKLSENHLLIELEDMHFTSKLIDGKFPDYQQVIPTGCEKQIICEREQLRQAFMRVAVLSNEKYRGILLKFSPGMLNATVHNPDQEEAEEQIEIDYEGEEFEIGFNVVYFQEALSVINENKVILSLRDTNHSCLISGEGNTTNRYVIMPMRL